MHSGKVINMMDKILRELDDVKKSQTSVLKKIAQVETENINLNADLLNDALPVLHQEIDETVVKLTVLLEQFKEARDEYARKNPPAPAA